jgi:hypothetical protein
MAEPSNTAGIDYCQRDHFLMRYQVGVSLRMRQKMFDALPLRPGMSLLEVGATPDMTFEDQNFFSKKALALGCAVSVTSFEDCTQMAARYGFRWLPMAPLMSDAAETFECVISAAVLEHVGEAPQKLEHLRLLGRLSNRYVAVMMPNRGHWFEIHTKLPLLHWLPKPLHRRILRAIGLSAWAQPSYMDLIGPREFRDLVKQAFPGCGIEFKYFRLLGAVSNLMAIVDKSR